MPGDAGISPNDSRARVGVRSGVTMAIEPAAHLHVRQCVSTGHPSSVWKNDSPTSSSPKPASRASARRTERERRVRNDILIQRIGVPWASGQAECVSGRYTEIDLMGLGRLIRRHHRGAILGTLAVYALLLAHYAVRVLMHQAACQANVDPDRLSFTDAVFVLCETTRELAQVPAEQREPLRQEMLTRLTAQLLPPRRLRANPRVLKKLYRKYKRKSRNEPAPPPFDPQDRFLDFVVLLI